MALRKHDEKREDIKYEEPPRPPRPDEFAPTPRETAVPRNYHVQLVDQERTIAAADVQIFDNGTLVFIREDGAIKIAYPAAHWKYVELETQDQ